MRKLRKLLMVMVMMFTIMLSLASCSNSSNTGNTGGNEVDLNSLTSADVFKNIEYTNLGIGMSTKKVSYAELSSSTNLDDSKSMLLKVVAFASYKFEVLKITAKFKSDYTNHTVGNKFSMRVYNSNDVIDEAKMLKELTKTCESKDDYNKEHYFEITFNSGEFLIDKNEAVGLKLGGSKYGYANWYNIEIQCRVVEA